MMIKLPQTQTALRKAHSQEPASSQNMKFGTLCLTSKPNSNAGHSQFIRDCQTVKEIAKETLDIDLGKVTFTYTDKKGKTIDTVYFRSKSNPEQQKTDDEKLIQIAENVKKDGAGFEKIERFTDEELEAVKESPLYYLKYFEQGMLVLNRRAVDELFGGE